MIKIYKRKLVKQKKNKPKCLSIVALWEYKQKLVKQAYLLRSRTNKNKRSTDPLPRTAIAAAAAKWLSCDMSPPVDPVDGISISHNVDADGEGTLKDYFKICTIFEVKHPIINFTICGNHFTGDTQLTKLHSNRPNSKIGWKTRDTEAFILNITERITLLKSRPSQ